MASMKRVEKIRSHLLKEEKIERRYIQVQRFTENVIVASTSGSIDLVPKINQDAVAYSETGALCLCDGHGELGEIVSHLVSRTIVERCCDKSPSEQSDVALDAQAAVSDKLKRSAYFAGCTGVWAFRKADTLVICNVGDSRCLLVDVDWNLVFETKDHKPNEPSELARIEAAGGKVLQSVGGVPRVGGLALSRAFGDFSATSQGVVATPDVTLWESDALKRLSFVFMASDGVFDAMTSEEVISFLMERRLAGDVMDDALARLLLECKHRWLVQTEGDYCDDITCAMWLL